MRNRLLTIFITGRNGSENNNCHNNIDNQWNRSEMCKLAVALILKHIVVLKKNNDREWLLEGFLQKETTIKKLRQKSKSLTLLRTKTILIVQSDSVLLRETYFDFYNKCQIEKYQEYVNILLKEHFLQRLCQEKNWYLKCCKIKTLVCMYSCVCNHVHEYIQLYIWAAIPL